MPATNRKMGHLFPAQKDSIEYLNRLCEIARGCLFFAVAPGATRQAPLLYRRAFLLTAAETGRTTPGRNVDHRVVWGPSSDAARGHTYRAGRDVRPFYLAVPAAPHPF